MTKRGKFIVFEGPNGSGKTSIIEGLQDYPGFSVRFPGTNPLGNLLRTWLAQGSGTVSDQTWIATAVAEMLLIQEQEIEPALARGTNVYCDRWFYSTAIYHKARHQEQRFERLLKPDLLVVCIADMNILRERVAKRSPERQRFVVDSQLSDTKRCYRYLGNRDEVLMLDTGGCDRHLKDCVKMVKVAIETLE